jgi:chromosome transmission fidelity protein 18
MTTFVANGLLGSTSLSSARRSGDVLSKSNAILGASLTPQASFHAGGEKQQEVPGKVHVFMVAQNLII